MKYLVLRESSNSEIHAINPGQYNQGIFQCLKDARLDNDLIEISIQNHQPQLKRKHPVCGDVVTTEKVLKMLHKIIDLVQQKNSRKKNEAIVGFFVKLLLA